IKSSTKIELIHHLICISGGLEDLLFGSGFRVARSNGRLGSLYWTLFSLHIKLTLLKILLTLLSHSIRSITEALDEFGFTIICTSSKEAVNASVDFLFQAWFFDLKIGRVLLILMQSLTSNTRVF